MRQLIHTGITLLLLCSLAGLGTAWYRFFDYFNHFRPQAAAAAGVLFVLALLWRCRVMAPLAFMLLLLNAGLIGWRAFLFMPPRGEPVSEHSVPITLLTANVLVDNNDTAAFMAQVRQNDPDIVAVLELNPAFETALAKLEERYPHHAVVARQDSFGMAIYAKWPFKETVTPLGWYKLPLLQADFGRFTLFAAHPVSPMSRIDRMDHSTYVQAIAKLAAASDKPLIAAGDFNMTLWAAAAQPLLDAGMYHIGGPLHYTWPDYFPPGAIQIDHVFATGGVTGAIKVLGAIGSDHFPVKAVLRVPVKD